MTEIPYIQLTAPALQSVLKLLPRIIMATISITNTAEPALDEMIQSRIYFMLGSSMASLKIVEMNVEKCKQTGQESDIIRCDLRVLEIGGKWHLVSTQQNHLAGAVEGSLTRLRRSLQRHRQYRMHG